MIHYEYYRSEKCPLEELIREIQNTGDARLWEVALKRTEKSRHRVFHKRVNPYYKTNMKDDVYTVIKQGWVKAVKSFNPVKGKQGFIAFSATIMWQAYVIFARRITKKKEGKSVRYMLMNDVNASSVQEMNEKLVEGASINILKTEDSLKEFDNLELKDYIVDMMSRLKNQDELTYEFIQKHYLENVTQKELSRIYNMSQSSVSRVLKRGLNILKGEMKDYY